MVLRESTKRERRGKSLHRASGGGRVVGRYNRAFIEWSHTMDSRGFRRYWPTIQSRLEHAGLDVSRVPDVDAEMS